jgi:hypothetical protein
VLYLVSIRKTSLSDIADCRWKMMQTLSAATVLNVGAWQDELLKKKAILMEIAAAWTACAEEEEEYLELNPESTSTTLP